jgi:hypothetical protein
LWVVGIFPKPDESFFFAVVANWNPVREQKEFTTRGQGYENIVLNFLPPATTGSSHLQIRMVIHLA